MLSAIRENLNVGADGYETAAVITMTEEEASDICRLLQNRGVEASYMDRNSSAFRKGLTVTTFYLAKGLEFDQVFMIREHERILWQIRRSISVLRELCMSCMYTEKKIKYKNVIRRR